MSEFASLLQNSSLSIVLAGMVIGWGIYEVVQAFTRRNSDVEQKVDELLGICREIDEKISVYYDDATRYRRAVEIAATMIKSTDPDLSASLLKLIK